MLDQVEFEFELSGTANICRKDEVVTGHPKQLIQNEENATPLTVRRLHRPGEAAAANVIGTVKTVGSANFGDEAVMVKINVCP